MLCDVVWRLGRHATTGTKQGEDYDGKQLVHKPIKSQGIRWPESQHRKCTQQQERRRNGTSDQRSGLSHSTGRGPAQPARRKSLLLSGSRCSPAQAAVKAAENLGTVRWELPA